MVTSMSVWSEMEWPLSDIDLSGIPLRVVQDTDFEAWYRIQYPATKKAKY